MADRVTGRLFATRSEVLARHGMAATSQPLATQAALDVLKLGGSAVDGAIAANAVLGLVEPTANGPGGDLFALVWDAESRSLHGLNASGRSPAALAREDLVRQGLARMPEHGPLTVTVPGAVDGWFELHARFGLLPMSQVLAPAIRHAREGFPVSEVIAWEWAGAAEKLRDAPGFAATYLPGGRAPVTGDVFQNPALASTLETIAADGRDAFYRGEIARTLAAFVERHGGYLAASDLAAHTSTWVEPVSASYRGHEVWQLPPNTQGIAVLQMLNVLEGYDLGTLGFGSADHLHLFLEAKKLAFEDRARFYADPEWSDVPVTELVSKGYAGRRRRLIDPRRAAARYDAGLDAGDTVYLTVADGEGNMVSLIQSVYLEMGSGLVPDGLGFALQNRGALFSLDEGHANVLEPGKRPFHTIIPGFVTREGEPWLSFGVMGGATQPQGQVQVLLNLIDFGMGLQEAGDAPRAVHCGSSEPTGEAMDAAGGTVALERGFPGESVRELVRRGHRVTSEVGVFGGFQAILYDAAHGVYRGASESRKDGQAAGY